MTERKGVAPVGLEVARQRAVDTLMEHFANDVLEMSEFERRLDVANGSATEAELNELLADLPAADLPMPARSVVPARGGTPVVVAHDRVKERGYLVSPSWVAPTEPGVGFPHGTTSSSESWAAIPWIFVRPCTAPE